MEPHGVIRRYSSRQTQSTPNAIRFFRDIPHADTLIAYWPMNEGSGRGVFDQTRNRISRWFVGEPTWTEGRFGAAVRFSENDQYMASVEDSKLNLGKGDFTVSLWFKGSPRAGWRHLLFNEGGRPMA